MEAKKKPYLSKTILTNLIVAVVAIAGFGDKLSATDVALGLSGINVMLRLITKDKIGFSA